MSAHSILNGPLSYMQVCVIATTVLRRAVKPSVMQARAAVARQQVQQRAAAASSPAAPSPSPVLFTHFAATASQQSAAALSPAQAQQAQTQMSTPASAPLVRTPVKLRSKPMSLTREQIILGVTLQNEGVMA